MNQQTETEEQRKEREEREEREKKAGVQQPKHGKPGEYTPPRDQQK